MSESLDSAHSDENENADISQSSSATYENIENSSDIGKRVENAKKPSK